MTARWAMPIAALLVAAAPASASRAAVHGVAAQAVATSGVAIHWEAPAKFLAGSPYFVEIELEAPDDGADLPGWMLSPSAFTVDDQALLERAESATVRLPAGAVLSLRFDLARYFSPERSFRLAYAPDILEEDPVDVELFHAAGKGIDFMSLPSRYEIDMGEWSSDAELPDGRLEDFSVLLETNRGKIYLELFPHIAPNHVRNFLDLAYAGFYDGVTFHRVLPGFMIQGGDPTGTGNGAGPRRLLAEFGEESHERGTLSMARNDDPDSASCQFFICHADAKQLDGKYSVFGRVKNGLDVVDEIAVCKRRGERPIEPQVILRAVVIDGAK